MDLQGGDLKFSSLHIYIEMKHKCENGGCIQILCILPYNKHNWLVFLKISTLSLNQGLQVASKGLATFANKNGKHLSPFSGDVWL